MNVFLPWSRFAVIALVAISLVGCSETPTPPQVEEPPPSADSPQAALRLLEWCWNGRDTTLYRTLLTDDFVFVFGALDPYGNAYRDHPWTRGDDLISTRTMFHGSASKGAAAQITLTLDRNFRLQVDPRPGKDPRWHKLVRSVQALTIIEADQVRRDVTGSSVFFLVRGDSAMIPQELLDIGIARDSTLWFVERWEDGSPISPGDRAMPTKSSTLGSIKVLYR